MNNFNKNKNNIKFILLWQLYIGIIFAVLVLIFTMNFIYFASAVVGGLISIISTLCYIFITFRNGFIHLPKVAYKNHQLAMLTKFILNIIIFILVLKLFKNCNFIILLTGYVVSMSSYWLSLIKVK